MKYYGRGSTGSFLTYLSCRFLFCFHNFPSSSFTLSLSLYTCIYNFLFFFWFHRRLIIYYNILTLMYRSSRSHSIRITGLSRVL